MLYFRKYLLIQLERHVADTWQTYAFGCASQRESLEFTNDCQANVSAIMQLPVCCQSPPSAQCVGRISCYESHTNVHHLKVFPLNFGRSVHTSEEVPIHAGCIITHVEYLLNQNAVAPR